MIIVRFESITKSVGEANLIKCLLNGYVSNILSTYGYPYIKRQIYAVYNRQVIARLLGRAQLLEVGTLVHVSMYYMRLPRALVQSGSLFTLGHKIPVKC